jgi:hypothetical protein
MHYDGLSAHRRPGGNRVSKAPVDGKSALLPLMLIYGAASLLHFLHNVIYLNDYPNLPLWLTAPRVVGAWLVIAAVGTAGYLVYSRISRIAGLLLIAVYALFGFGGLDHYAVAAISAHTVAMNLTILLEAASALALLAYVVRCVLPRADRRTASRG